MGPHSRARSSHVRRASTVVQGRRSRRARPRRADAVGPRRGLLSAPVPQPEPVRRLGLDLLRTDQPAPRRRLPAGQRHRDPRGRRRHRRHQHVVWLPRQRGRRPARRRHVLRVQPHGRRLAARAGHAGRARPADRSGRQHRLVLARRAPPPDDGADRRGLRQRHDGRPVRVHSGPPRLQRTSAGPPATRPRSASPPPRTSPATTCASRSARASTAFAWPRR